MRSSPLNLAVLVSGSGTTLQNLLDRIAARELNARIGIVIGSRLGILGIGRAEQAGVAACVIDRRQYRSVSAFSQAVFSRCEEAGADLTCLGGWLSLLELPTTWAGRVMNIHPALLPSFGGKGMYGRRVHQAVLDGGCKVTGCSVHFVDASYDSGPIILQRACAVAEDDTPDSLARRVFEEERVAYPQAIRLFQENRLRIEGRRVRVLEPSAATPYDRDRTAGGPR